ncbi:hypothetical protein [Tateyamaria sp. SN6-1]|uniref:hypothetical protein n=1 Tax=Tateyamaria sp. SN6-1 TaxID=3092148 RepID=UPI0039F54A92
MMVAVLALWLAFAVYLFGRSLAYLAALFALPDWVWIRDARLWLLVAPFLLPVAVYFYQADASALVIVVLAFAMLMGWVALYVFRSLLSEAQDGTARTDRVSHFFGAGAVVFVIAVVLLSRP